MREVWKLGSLALLLILCCLAAAWVVNGSAIFKTGKSWADEKQNPATTGKPKIVVVNQRYEFEAVPEGQEIKHDFIIENHGQAPLNIKNVRPG